MTVRVPYQSHPGLAGIKQDQQPDKEIYVVSQKGHIIAIIAFRPDVLSSLPFNDFLFFVF